MSRGLMPTRRFRFVATCAGALLLLAAGGCISAGSMALLGRSMFTDYVGSAGTTGGTSGGASTFFSGGGRVETDPCAESNARKFIRISMRNMDPDDYIHYFFVAIAFVNSDQYPTGAVCPDDITLYTANGYEEIPEGSMQAFGNYCIEGPALIYFHENGQFRSGGGIGGAQLASAIGPAQGTNPTYDSFFGPGGAALPVPNVILFHNPGTGDGANLQVSTTAVDPCGGDFGSLGTPNCLQDAFYYVDDVDLLAGSIILGSGAGRRVPNEIQGTGCQCGAFATIEGQDFQAAQVLAPSGTTASEARCNEFLRGGTIEYVFIRDDRNPPIPQLLTRVTDQYGSEVHTFDSRANVP